MVNIDSILSDPSKHKRALTWILLHMQLEPSKTTSEDISSFFTNTYNKTVGSLKNEYDKTNIALTLVGVGLGKIPFIGGALSALTSIAKKDPYSDYKIMKSLTHCQSNWKDITSSRLLVDPKTKYIPIQNSVNDDRLNILGLMGASRIKLMADLAEIDFFLAKECAVYDLRLNDLINIVIANKNNIGTFLEPDTKLAKRIDIEQFRLQITSWVQEHFSHLQSLDDYKYWNHDKPFTSLFMYNQWEVNEVYSDADDERSSFTRITFNHDEKLTISNKDWDGYTHEDFLNEIEELLEQDQ
ncbi:hypothetical protein NDJ29_11510 [Vibrio alginolyticus]|uniref:hypothetical protein n=1 Tax=Vibrio alginolyticus TaxID=663 RepID=UPI00215E7740|nr:hypothetical protein [Vibrio alginolyticus]MCS0195436.1 hypothetical protein [Vibrio alginolyticus]